MLLSACLGDGDAHSVEGQHSRSKALKGILQMPSRSWVMEKIRQIRHDYMLSRCKTIMRRSVLHARRHGMFRLPVDVSIDMHDVPLHAKCMRLVYTVFSKGKSGTIRFNRLATIHCVVDGCRLVLGVEIVRRGVDTAEVVTRLLEECRRNRILISTITLDRGFYSVSVIEAIKAQKISMIIPAVKTDGIKKAVQEYRDGKRAAISEYTLTSSGGKTTQYKLVILKREEKSRQTTEEAKILAKLYKKQVRIIDQHYVFATTMSDEWIDGDPTSVAKFYKRRWGIENAYETLRPRTTSINLSVRILWLFLPFMLYNIWIIGCFIAARDQAYNGRRPPCTLNLFIALLVEAADTQVRQPHKPPD